MIKHGHFKGGKPSLTYSSWHNALARCNRFFDSDHKSYWGKGIRVCERWSRRFDDGEKNDRAFLNFLEDMGERPGENYVLGRLDHDKDYSKENCRWELKNDTN